MGSRLSIVAGLLAGLLAAGALLLGFVFVGPDPVRATPSPGSSESPAASPTNVASPSAPAASSSPGPSTAASPSAPAGSGSPGPSTAASPSAPAGSGSPGPSQVTAALSPSYWVDNSDIVRDGALGGIGPDVMTRGLQSILPGVVVTPRSAGGRGAGLSPRSPSRPGR